MVDKWSCDDPGGAPSAPPGTIRLETPNGSNISSTIVLAVEELTGTPVEEIPSLSRCIDTDALDRLFEPWLRENCDGGGTIQFRYADCTVTVDSEGVVVVRHSTEPES